jgi:hypothetical protein
MYMRCLFTVFSFCHFWYFYGLSSAFAAYCYWRDAAFEVTHLCVFFETWDLRFSKWWILRLLSSGILCHVVWQKVTNVSEELAVSILRPWEWK